MELQRTTAGTLAPPRTSGTEGVWSVLGRLIFCIAVPLPIQSKNRIVTPRRKISFIFHFCRPDASHVLASSSTHCNHPRKYFQRTLKSKEWLVIFCAPASVPSKQCSTAQFSLKKARKNTSPLSGKNAPLFPLRPPLSDRRRAQRCGERTSRVCAHPRASVGFRFLPSPFTLGPQQPDCSSVGGEDAAHFSSFTAAPDVCSPGEGRSAKAFTPYALTVNALTPVGEEVKAKNEKCLTRAHA